MQNLKSKEKLNGIGDGSRSHGPDGSPHPTTTTGYPCQGNEDPHCAMSWLPPGFCWQCCTHPWLLSLPEPLKGCQPLPRLNIQVVEVDTWAGVTSGLQDSSCHRNVSKREHPLLSSGIQASGSALQTHKLLLLKDWISSRT